MTRTQKDRIVKELFSALNKNKTLTRDFLTDLFANNEKIIKDYAKFITEQTGQDLEKLFTSEVSSEN